MNASKQGLIVSNIDSVALVHTGEGSLCVGLLTMIPLAV